MDLLCTFVITKQYFFQRVNNIVTERNERGFYLFSQNLREASSLYEGDEVFWSEDLIAETTKRVHDSYTILTLIAHLGKE